MTFLKLKIAQFYVLTAYVQLSVFSSSHKPGYRRTGTLLFLNTNLRFKEDFCKKIAEEREKKRVQDR